MRVILWLVSAMVLLWCGYWYISAGTLRSGVETALAVMKAEGRADYSAIELDGFPARFRLTVADAVLRNPEGAWIWHAANVVVHALAYSPGQVIAVLPDDQTLALEDQTVALQTTDMRASVAFGLTSTLPLEHAEALSGGIAARSDLGWSLTATELRLAIRSEDPATFRYRLGAESSGLTLEGFPAEMLARAKIANGPGHLRLDLDATFDRPLDRSAGETPPRPTAAAIHALEFDWGAFSLSGQGDLTITPDGTPDGTLSLSLANWRGLPPLLVASGAITVDMEQPLTRVMKQLATLSGQPDQLSLPLTFKAGWVALGPIPLGPAPKF